MANTIEKMFELLDNSCPKLMAYYQELRLAITRDVDGYWRTNHFLTKKKMISKKKYCIFVIPYSDYSLFAAAGLFVFWCEWALRKGFIPILDIEYRYSFLQHRIGEDNKWEYCFQQPINVKEAGKYDCVYIKSSGVTYLQKTCMDINGRKDDVYIHVKEESWRSYYANINKYVKKCWVFKQELLDDFEKEYGYQMQKAKNILGVFLRETFSEDFYNHLSASEKKIYDKHPRVPNVEETIDIVKKYLSKWECDCIFLSTIYQDSVERFKLEFGDKVMAVDRVRYNSIMHFVESRVGFEVTEKERYEKEKQQDEREKMVSYAKEVIGLSRCDYLIAAKGSGAAAALSINGGRYKDIHVLSDLNKSVWY